MVAAVSCSSARSAENVARSLDSALQSLSTFKAGVVAAAGVVQVEEDLQRQPPDYGDAKARLAAVLAALAQPANTSDPQLAQQRLHDVLAMHRYDALHRPPSLLDRFVQWVGDRINQLLGLLCDLFAQ